MRWVYDDGGRKEAGYRGKTDDCVCRAVAIATGLPYAHVYQQLEFAAAVERPRGRKCRSHPRTGVHIPTIRRFLAGLGWEWVPTMGIGTGCRVHCRPEELPGGTLILNLSRHLTAVVDSVIHDTHDPSRDGTRCVYGYWYYPNPET